MSYVLFMKSWRLWAKLIYFKFDVVLYGEMVVVLPNVTGRFSKYHFEVKG